MPLLSVINNFRKKSILIIGDIILDRFVYGKVNRISPEAPVPIVEVVSETNTLGGAGNVANNITSLGGKVSIITVIGKDNAGKTILNLLNQNAINPEGVFEDKRPTTLKTRVIAHNQQVVRFDRESKEPLTGSLKDKLIEYIKDAVPKHDAVIISDYQKGVISAKLVQVVVDSAKPKGIFVAVDPKVKHFHFYKNVSIITPNLQEASQGSGVEITDQASLYKSAQTIMQKLNCQSLLITRSEQGMSLFERQGKKIVQTDIPTFAKKVFDVTGAGDTAIAVFTLAHVSGATLHSSAIIANHAAGIVVGEVGTAVVSPAKLIESLKLWQRL